MYDVDAFWQCDSCGYSNAALDRCIMCNARGPLAPTIPAPPSQERSAEDVVEREPDDEWPTTVNVAEFRKATYTGGPGPSKAARRANRRRATRTIVLLVVALVVSEILTGIMAYGSGLAGVDLVKFNLLTGVVFFGMFGLFVLARSREMGIRPVYVTGGKGWAVAEGIVVGGGEALLMTLLFRLITGRPSADPTSLGLAAEGTIVLLLFGLAVTVVMAPLTEELVFRGFMAEAFRSRGKWVAIGASALAFALAHRMLFAIPYFFVGGVILGLVYFHRGLLGSISAHAAFNGMLLVFALAVVAGPPVNVESDGSFITLPGHWHVDEEENGYVAAIGPLGARFELTHFDLPGPVAAAHLAMSFANSGVTLPDGISVDPASVAVTQLPAGEAVTFTAEVYGLEGKVVMLPRDARVWVLSMQTQGSARAEHDWQSILWSWRVP